MSKKDYVLIADAINEGWLSCESGDNKCGAFRVVNKIVEALKSDNDRFDARRFLLACGMTADNNNK